MYLVSEMENYVYSSPEAMEEYNQSSHLLTEPQKSKLLSATISKDGNEWCILSGPDLTFDRSGFGITIADAIKDYMSIYAQKKAAS